MKYSVTAFALCLFLAGLSSPSFADDSLSPSRFALGVGVGTNGAVVEGSYKVNTQIVLRGQGAFLDFRDNFKSSDVEYRGSLHSNTGGGFLDLHPFSNPWLVSAGAVAGARKVDVTATPSVTGTIKIDGAPYSVTQVGAVQGDIDFGSPAPFLGLGWDNTFYTARSVGFRAVVGVIFGDQPQARLSAVGPFATNSAVLSELAGEQASLQRDAEDYRYYPLVQVGVNYRF